MNLFNQYCDVNSESELAVRELNSNSTCGMKAEFCNENKSGAKNSSNSSTQNNDSDKKKGIDMSRRRYQGPFGEPAKDLEKHIPPSKNVVTKEDYENSRLKEMDPQQGYMNVDIKKASEGYQRMKPGQKE